MVVTRQWLEENGVKSTGSIHHFQKLVGYWTTIYMDNPERAAYDLLAAPKNSVHLACARAALENKLTTR